MAITDIITGRVQLMFLVASSVKAHIQSGKLRALATTTEKPTTLFPGMPTVAAAVPGYESAAQFGFFAPAKTPAAIVNRLSQETVRFLNLPETKERYFNLGMEKSSPAPPSSSAPCSETRRTSGPKSSRPPAFAKSNWYGKKSGSVAGGAGSNPAPPAIK